MDRHPRIVRLIGTALLALAPGLAACADEGDGTTGPVPGLPPTVLGVEPAVVEAGGRATVRGLNFGTRASSNGVEFGSVTAEVLSSSETSLRIRLPEPNELPCRPTRRVPLRVTVAGRGDTVAHPFSVAPGISLEPGQSRALVDADDRVDCREFPAADAEFLLSVFNSSRVPSSRVSFELRGRTGAGSGPEEASAGAAGRLGGGDRGGPGRLPPLVRRTLEADEGHRALLETNRRVVERARSRPGGTGLVAPRSERAAAAGVSPDHGPPQVGDHVQFRVPDLSTGDVCENFVEVTGRVAHVTPHAVLVSDTANPIDGEYDDRLREMGQEFEDRMWPVVRDNYGDPLRLDDQLNHDGRLFMLFTPEVNDFGSALAFVFTGDFFPRQSDDPDQFTCSSSDEAEIFYGRAPTRVAPDDYGSLSATAGWQRILRSTLVHEVKHLAANAERIARGLSLETVWLEESTAHMAEELYARRVFDFSRGSNATYDETLRCAVRPTGQDGCPTGRPFVMVSEFVWLAQYLANTPSRSPIQVTFNSTFRGSGWWLLRWAVDHAPVSESEFLTSMTTSPATGIRNVEARLGRSWTEILSDWTLSLAVDDAEGRGVERDELTVPSWDVRDIYRGLHEDFGDDNDLFAEPYPLATRTQRYGRFTRVVSRLPGSSTAIFRLIGTSEASQLLELVGDGGGALPPGLRMSVVRLR